MLLVSCHYLNSHLISHASIASFTLIIKCYDNIFQRLLLWEIAETEFVGEYSPHSSLGRGCPGRHCWVSLSLKDLKLVWLGPDLNGPTRKLSCQLELINQTQRINVNLLFPNSNIVSSLLITRPHDPKISTVDNTILGLIGPGTCRAESSQLKTITTEKDFILQ